MNSKFYITTAIDYVNDTIHIGHAFQKIAADVLARYYRIKLGNENVFFLTGTDEYGKKAEKAAGDENLSPHEFVRKISDSDQKQQDALNISYNRFIRTTDSDHTKVAQEIWRRVKKSGDIYLGEYTGLYCEGCEAYYKEEDLVDGKCPFHQNQEVKRITEKNYFFKWTRYKDFLIKHIKNNPNFIYPHHRANEMLEFAKNIEDIPISRSNFTWGVSIPGETEQVIYVWFDALTNYLTGIGFLDDKALFDKFWPADIHILGKDNLRWHSLLWPAMLKSAEIELPKTILVNGFLTLNGQKISKSLGNVVRPTDWVKKYGADAVRYYLLRYTNITEDSDISEDKFKKVYNADLANGLGNLVARVARLCETSGFKQLAGKKNFHFIEQVNDYKKALDEFRFNEALSLVFAKIAKLDKYINEEKPWELLKVSANHKGRGLSAILSHAVDQIVEIAILLEPFMPRTAKIIKDQFTKINITSQKPLFPRI
ncbi:MAG: methionine--tRNA ligase [Candidatus Levybacteria bacterium]|nr:methionine--tRNA ligase [Candidatus Levybacteria bacterium]